MGEITLKRKEWSAKAWESATHESKHVLKVYGGLHYLKGNRLPYFSLTGATWIAGREDMGGCIHETILEHFPEFADLAALHLSDIDGVPSHSAANGLYFIAGTFADGLKQQYYYGSPDWKTPHKREKTEAESMRVACEHFRCTPEALEPLRRELRKWADNYLCGPKEGTRKRMESAVSEFVEAQKERWKREALECIKRHGLKVYGYGLPKDGINPEDWKKDGVPA